MRPLVRREQQICAPQTLNIHTAAMAHEAARVSAAVAKMARIPATRSTYPAGSAHAFGSDSETTPRTKKPSPIKRRNMCGATSQRRACLRLPVRSHGHAKSGAVTEQCCRTSPTFQLCVHRSSRRGQFRMSSFSSGVVMHRSRTPNWPASFTSQAARTMPVIAAR